MCEGVTSLSLILRIFFFLQNLWSSQLIPWAIVWRPFAMKTSLMHMKLWLMSLQPRRSAKEVPDNLDINIFWPTWDLKTVKFITVCQRSVFCPKTKIFWTACKMVNFYVYVKIDYFLVVKKFEIFEFSRLNWSKIGISLFLFGQFLAYLNSKIFWNFSAKIQIG